MFRLPLWHNRNLRIHYILNFIFNLFYITATWVFFWLLFVNYKQLGLLDACAFTFGLLLEIPTGAIADSLGKRKTVILAMFFCAIGGFLIALTTVNTSWMIWVGFLIIQAGWALWSGAEEALAFDTLVEIHEEDKYDEIVSKTGTLILIANVIATIIGGITGSINLRIPQFLWVANYVVATPLAFFLVEPKVDTEKFTWKGYFSSFVMGFKELLTPVLRKFFIPFIVLSSIYFIFDWGFIKQALAISFGLSALEISVTFSIAAILCAVIILLFPWLKKKLSEVNFTLLLLVMMASGFLLSLFTTRYYGIIALYLIFFAGTLMTPLISTVINKHISSKYRATTISTAAMLSKLPYALLAITAGELMQENKLGLFSLAIVVTIVFAILFFAVQQQLAVRNQKQQ